MVIWAGICWYSAGTMITPNGRVTASDCMDSLGNQVHPVVQMCPNDDVVFPNDNSPKHAARSVQARFEHHEDAPQQLPWPSQSLVLSIIEPLWSV